MIKFTNLIILDKDIITIPESKTPHIQYNIIFVIGKKMK